MLAPCGALCYKTRMATIGTRIHTWLSGRYVGRDEFSNRYYEERRNPKAGTRRRRWVMYNGMAEPSKVPAHWHGWLHHTHDRPAIESARRFGWQKEHLPNLTGTVTRHLPSGHTAKGGKRAANSADYQPWKPE
jgi:NADH:ubiquinone oxidoreductase subunit